MIDSLHTLNLDCLLKNPWKTWGKRNILSDLRDVVSVRHYIHTTALEFLLVMRSLLLMRVSVRKLLRLLLLSHSLFLHIVCCPLVIPTLSTAACAVIRGAGGTLILCVYALAFLASFLVLLSSPVFLAFCLKFLGVSLRKSFLISFIHTSRVTLMVIINMRETS